MKPLTNQVLACVEITTVRFYMMYVDRLGNIP